VNAWINAYGGYPFDLLTYSSLRINAPLNLKLSDSDVNTIVIRSSLLPPFDTKLSSYCSSGWLGKRLSMGLQGNSTDWNIPNIIMIDNYNPTVRYNQFNWVLPKYSNGVWVKDWEGGYVDFIVRLNQLSRDSSLSAVSNFSDNQCLQ
jgi:hypothetical protein